MKSIDIKRELDDNNNVYNIFVDGKRCGKFTVINDSTSIEILFLEEITYNKFSLYWNIILREILYFVLENNELVGSVYYYDDSIRENSYDDDFKFNYDEKNKVYYLRRKKINDKLDF